MCLLIISCEKSFVPIENNDIDIKDQSKKISFNLKVNNSNEIKCDGTTQTVIQDSKSIFYQNIQLPETKYNSILNDFLKLNIEGTPVYTLLYLNKEIPNNSYITINDIKSISIYNYNDNKLIHHLYVIKNGVNKENPFYKAESNTIYSDVTEFILKNETNYEQSSSSTVIFLIRNDIKNFNLKNPKREILFRIALKDKIKLKNETIKKEDEISLLDIDKSNNKYCGGMCPWLSDPAMICMSIGDFLPRYACFIIPDEGTCPASINYDKLTEDSTYTALANQSHNFDLYYSFRDNFLYETTFGNAYVNYYWVLSSYIYENVTLSLAIQTADVLIDFNEVIVRILNPSVYGNTQLMSLQTKNKLLNLLNTFKSLNQDTYFQLMIDDVIDDVNTLWNLTINQFFQLIGFVVTP